MRDIIFFSILFLSGHSIFSQTISIDARVEPPKILSGHLKMGNPGLSGKEILINNKYMTIGDKPVIPVMGEIHYSRYLREQWEDAILKMKANGINIIACYVFWIHHEEMEGQFEWTGNKDLRHFLELCKKHDLFAYPRIGPWCHGEVRNGGTPDWILSKTYIEDRSNQPVYQYYADRWYSEVAKQLKGLLYKDNGPVIGVQFENEYRRGPNGEAHILWLKQTAQKQGIDVPMYTVTGWGNASVPQDEVIPLWGGYPAEPWATHIDKIEENLNFTFEAPMNDGNIGNEAVQSNKSYIQDYSRYPYFTCELGVGNQLSYHRRPVISEIDGLAIALAKTGSGSNLPGYYVFTGGLNPIGIHTTMEENRDETGYWNEYPDISYDFQAAIRETGEIAPSYHQVKKLHYFLNEFGDRLAPMTPVVIKNQDYKNALQYALRVNNNAGFVFALNYYRGIKKLVQKNVRFEIILPDERLVFPAKGVDIPDSSSLIWPFNFDLDGVLLKYASAQPLCKLEKDGKQHWVFIQNKGIIPEFCFEGNSVSSVTASSGKTDKKENNYIVSQINPGLSAAIIIKDKNGTEQEIIVLSSDQADKVWFFKNQDKKYFFISNVNLYMNGKELNLFGPDHKMELESFQLAENISFNGKDLKPREEGNFYKYNLELPLKTIVPEIRQKQILDDVKWLKSSVDEINKKELHHKLFIKEFNLGNPSKIKSASLFIYSDNDLAININQQWINTKINTSALQKIDITGYVKSGDNIVMLDFPVTNSMSSFAARIIVEFFNSDKAEILTDKSWLTVTQYLTPVPGRGIKGLIAPEIAEQKKINNDLSITGFNEWAVSLPDNAQEGLNNLYLHIDFNGDLGKCRLNHRLISDNFNNGTHWPIELKHLGNAINGNSLTFEIYPLKEGYKIYFEKQVENVGKTEIKSIRMIPEYKVCLVL